MALEVWANNHNRFPDVFCVTVTEGRWFQLESQHLDPEHKLVYSQHRSASISSSWGTRNYISCSHSITLPDSNYCWSLNPGLEPLETQGHHWAPIVLWDSPEGPFPLPGVFSMLSFLSFPIPHLNKSPHFST